MVVQNQADMGKGSAIPTDPLHTPTIIQPSTSQPQKKQRSRRPKKKDTEERDDSLERAATTATNLDAEYDRDNINKTQSKATPNEPIYLGTSSGSGPQRQETIGGTIAQTRSKNVSKFSNDLLLVRGNTLRSGGDRLKLQELIKLCTNLQNRVIDLENTKTAHAQEITSLKLRVKKLEKKGGLKTYKLKRLYKVGRSARIVYSDETSLGDKGDASKQGRKINDIDKDAEITLVDETQGRYGDYIMFDVSDLVGEEVFVTEQGVSDKDVNLSVDEVTLAQALAALKSANKKIQDKGKAKMIEPEPVKKLSKKDQLKIDEEVAQRLQAEFDEQERIKREKVEANIALKETWDDIQPKIEADRLLAERLQAREQEELTI
ncbi:hypothetical protein Tco_0998788 [Tanacetum coccineum]